MSRFESSRFTRNALVINPEVIKKACDKLGEKAEKFISFSEKEE